ncbi:hypothetical protein KEM55_004572 [Ascosphaera atra]|nr:hypothetical protein KEM55_004572 [Ascosphaera atra]
MPSLALLHASFSTPVPSTPPKRTVRFVLADYNTTVLRLVTLPNIILTWHHCRQEREREVVATTEAQVQQDGEDEDAEEVAPRKKDEELELDIDESVLSSFQDELKARNLQLHFIAGAWSPEFNDLAVPISPESEEKEALLLLASETIYSPASLRPFSETLISLFSRRSSSAKALIAAKKVYFGVGGGVDEFVSVLEKLEEEKGQKVSVENKQDVEDAGVGRVILQAQLVR